MNASLSLPETQQPHVPEYSIFLAIFPDPLTAQCIAGLANEIRLQHGMHGRVRPVNHLHVSMPCFNVVNFKTMDLVCQIVAAATCPFEINFDQVSSFRDSPGNRPLVLENENRGKGGVWQLQELLHAEFAKHCVSPIRPVSKFAPHVTLLYDKQEFDPMRIEPIFWTVKEIALIRSEVGATKYHRMGRWVFGR